MLKLHKVKKITIELLLGFVKDFHKMMIELTSCEWLEIAQIIAFGMVVNGLYGFLKQPSFSDLYITILSLYAIMKARKTAKEKKC